MRLHENGYESHSEDGETFISRVSTRTPCPWGIWWKGIFLVEKPTRQAARESIRAFKLSPELVDVLETLDE